MYRLIMLGIIHDLDSRRVEKVRLCGMRLISCLLLVCISGCSKKKEDAPAPAPIATPGSAVAATGSGSATVANPVPAAPKLTTERFFNEQYSSFLSTKRGVLLADGDNPPEHLCGSAIGTAMVRLGTIANAAKATAKPEDCVAINGFTYCTFTPSGGDKASFVFDRDEVLVAVWIGKAVDRASELSRELAAPRECKRD